MTTFDFTSLPHIIQESSEFGSKFPTSTSITSSPYASVGVQRPMMQEADGVRAAHHATQCSNPRGSRAPSPFSSTWCMTFTRRTSTRSGASFEKVSLCRLPAMIGSQFCHTYKSDRKNECRLDHGGYFIINGIEKALLAQEKLHTNRQMRLPRQAALQVSARLRDSLVPRAGCVPSRCACTSPTRKRAPPRR